MRFSTTAAIALSIAIASLVVFGTPAWRAGITNWDDGAYLDNPAARAISNATFTSVVMGHYHPLTMLSFAVQQQAFGRNARMLHMTNVALHAVCSALVVYLLVLLSGSQTAAAIGGFFFAIHPLRVESVLWIAERKDVLFALFYVATLIAYVISERGERGRLRGAVAIFFLLSLLSKSAAVTLPLALLMIDYLDGRLSWRAVARKVPYFIVSVMFGVIALTAARAEQAADLPGRHFTLVERIALSCSTMLSYLSKMVMPSGLSAFYPYPQSVRAVDVAAVASIVLIAVIAIISTRATRAIAFALGFFVVTVSVTLPLVSVGPVVAADRYTYIPSIGIAYGIGIALSAMIRKWRYTTVVVIAAAALLLGATIRRAAVWRDSATLWTSVIEYDPGIAKAWNNRGAALAEAGMDGAAWRDFSTAIALDPCYRNAVANRILLALKHADVGSAKRDRDLLARCAGNRSRS